jgi:hypothetical protein
MKKTTLKIFANTILLIGTWVFISNVLDSGKDERVLAGLGGALIYAYVSLNEFWILDNMKMKWYWKIISFLFSIIGIWLFVTNTLDSGKDERILAGLGGAITLLGTILKDNLSNIENAVSHKDRNNSTLFVLIFITVFTFWGLHHKDIRYVESNVYGLQSEINSLDSKVIDLENYSHNH